MPLPVLVASVVLGLLTGVVAVVVSTRGEERPAVAEDAAGRAVGSDDRGDDRRDDRNEDAVVVDAVRLLRGWDARRARAYARGAPSALAALYTAGSRTGAADVAVLRGYVARHLRVTGMRTQVLGAQVVRHDDGRLVVDVTDVLVGAVAASVGRRWPLPRDHPTTRRVVLVRHVGGWRVREAYEAD